MMLQQGDEGTRLEFPQASTSTVTAKKLSAGGADSDRKVRTAGCTLDTYAYCCLNLFKPVHACTHSFLNSHMSILIVSGKEKKPTGNKWNKRGFDRVWWWWGIIRPEEAVFLIKKKGIMSLLLIQIFNLCVYVWRCAWVCVVHCIHKLYYYLL